MPDFAIVDAHVHLYDPSALPYAWMKDEPKLSSPHRPWDFESAISPVTVDKMVFVEVDIDSGFHLDEARWVAELAAADSRIQGMIVSLPLEDGGRAVEADLRVLADMPLVKGVRRLIQNHPGEAGWCLQPGFVGAVRMLGERGLSFELGIVHPQMADAIELVRLCPEVSFMLDHIGKPGIRDGVREPWWSEVRVLAELPNVVCKVSGVITEADHSAWTYDQVAPYVVRALDCFGFDRVAFGGDWPVVDLAGGYAPWIDVLDRVTAGTEAADLRKLYRDNAIRHYRL